MRNVYCISGLGADSRIFKKLSIKNANLIHLSWPEHSEKDTMETYAVKVSQMIPEENPIVVGLSFGGMIATEISRLRATKKTILVSSAKNMYEKPQIVSTFKSIINSGIIPSIFYKTTNPVLYYLFGVESVDDKNLLRGIIKDSNSDLVKWSVKAIANWDNNGADNQIVHIHGRNDKLITAKNIKADEWIEDGGHMMIYNRADEVSRFIEKEIEKL